MSIQIDQHSLETAPVEKNAHLMPCHIDHNGEANVESYFTNCIHEKPEGGLAASFRGRPLDGKTMAAPTGYTGYVMKEPRREFAETDDRKFTVEKKFSEFTFWNLDRPPSDNDKFPNALKWCKLASGVHDPICPS